MAVQANIGQQIVIADLDVSCNVKSFRGSAQCDQLDATAVCTTGWRTIIGGLKSWELSADGMVDFANNSVDAKLGIESVGNALTPVSVMPSADGGADGAVAFSGQATHVDYSVLGAVGEIAPFRLQASGRKQPLVRGTVMHPSSMARTASGNGTGFELGALSGAQSIFMALHVLAISGSPTFAVILESDDNGAFSSATTRITSSSYSAATGSEWQILTGPITDDWWRVRWTISGGSSPSVSFLAVAGIATYV